MSHLLTLAKNAKTAAAKLALYDTKTKNKGLLAIADALERRQAEILSANELDMASAAENGLRPTMLDRLKLTAERVADMAKGVRDVAALADPVGAVLDEIHRPSGLLIRKQRVPLGVIGIIYEARPNVTVDAAVLCLKSGNAAFLRGGKEAFGSNMTLMSIMRDALDSVGLDRDCVILLDDTSRQTADEMMKLRGHIDVLIPRGGAGLIRAVLDNATVPVIETGTGNCHLYVDKSADLAMATEILFNGKCSRPSVCNSLETVLVHQAVAAAFLPMAEQRLAQCQVEWRACPQAAAQLTAAKRASEADFADEFSDYILAARVVEGLDEALGHIARYSTRHSEVIVTADTATAERFLNEVDAAAVYVNASTRFTDGGEFGRGAEIGISTQKMHARGPMGLEELCSYKYTVRGNGQIR